MEIVSYAMGEGSGYEEGYKAGEESTAAYQDGYNAGETAGYASGYSAGYDEGVASVTSIKDLIETRGNVQQLFNGLTPDNNETVDQKIARLLKYSDTENISNFNNMLSNSSATVIPSFDTHNAESFAKFFGGSNNYIVNAGTLKTYNATDLSYLCSGCENLKSIYIDNNENISYNLYRAFYGCKKLNNLTFKNTPKVSSDSNAFQYAFYNAYLRGGAFPYIDTSAVDNFSFSFAADYQQMSVMQSIPLYDLSGADAVIGLRNIFDYRKIYEIPNMILPSMTESQWNTFFSNKSDFYYFFKGNIALGKLGFTNIMYKLDISVSNAFTRDTLNEVIGNLADLTGRTAKTLVIGATNLAKLTEDDIAVATDKNWTVA